jgi:serine/threonine protein phosphatase 1
MITVAIGDIHGMYDMLGRLLVEINAFSIRERGIGPPKLVFLGDYVDRGPDARRVVRRVRALQGDFAVCLRGNHEEMMVRREDRPIDWQNFVLNGGAQTLASYQGHEEEFEDDRRWMSLLATSYEDELRIFVHAGINPGQPLAEQTDDTRMWARNEFLVSQAHFPNMWCMGTRPRFCSRDHLRFAKTDAISTTALVLAGPSRWRSSTTPKPNRFIRSASHDRPLAPPSSASPNLLEQ